MIQLIENYQAIVRKRVFLLLIFIVNFSFSQGLKTSGKKIVDKNGNEVLTSGLAKKRSEIELLCDMKNG